MRRIQKTTTFAGVKNTVGSGLLSGWQLAYICAGSDVIYTKVLGQHMLSLNSVEAATDLLDKRGLNYSDRPRFTLFEV